MKNGHKSCHHPPKRRPQALRGNRVWNGDQRFTVSERQLLKEYIDENPDWTLGELQDALGNTKHSIKAIKNFVSPKFVTGTEMERHMSGSGKGAKETYNELIGTYIPVLGFRDSNLSRYRIMTDDDDLDMDDVRAVYDGMNEKPVIYDYDSNTVERNEMPLTQEMRAKVLDYLRVPGHVRRVVTKRNGNGESDRTVVKYELEPICDLALEMCLPYEYVDVAITQTVTLVMSHPQMLCPEGWSSKDFKIFIEYHPVLGHGGNVQKVWARLLEKRHPTSELSEAYDILTGYTDVDQFPAPKSSAMPDDAREALEGALNASDNGNVDDIELARIGKECKLPFKSVKSYLTTMVRERERARHAAERAEKAGHVEVTQQADASVTTTKSKWADDTKQTEHTEQVTQGKKTETTLSDGIVQVSGTTHIVPTDLTPNGTVGDGRNDDNELLGTIVTNRETKGDMVRVEDTDGTAASSVGESAINDVIKPQANGTDAKQTQAGMTTSPSGWLEVAETVIGDIVTNRLTDRERAELIAFVAKRIGR